MPYNLIAENNNSTSYITTILIPIFALCVGFALGIIILRFKRRRRVLNKRNSTQPEVIYDTIDESQIRPIEPPECPPRPEHTQYLGVLEPYLYDEVREPQPLMPWIKPVSQSSNDVGQSGNDGYEIPRVKHTAM
jgi:hypothetical protein